MEIGEVEVIWPQKPVLERLRLLHPENHPGATKNLFGRFGSRRRIHDFRPLSGVVGVFKAAGLTGTFLHQHGVSVLAHDLNPGGGYGDAILARLSLFEYSDNHDSSPLR